MLIVSLEEMTKIIITIAHNQLAHNNSSGFKKFDQCIGKENWLVQQF